MAFGTFNPRGRGGGIMVEENQTCDFDKTKINEPPPGRVEKQWSFLLNKFIDKPKPGEKPYSPSDLAKIQEIEGFIPDQTSTKCEKHNRYSLRESMYYTLVTAIIGIFPSAYFLACIGLFPLPFGGFVGGSFVAVSFAVIFFGFCGGFVVVPVLAALAGLISFAIAQRTSYDGEAMSIFFGFLTAIFSCLLPWILDSLIGPI